MQILVAGPEPLADRSAHPWPRPPHDAATEPPCTDPYARWWGRGGAVRFPPIPIVSPHNERRRGCAGQARA
jgi:hypothetical protein